MYRTGLTLCIAFLSTAASAAPSPTAASISAPRQMADATPRAPTASAVTTGAAPAEKKICKMLPSSYSHSSERVCLTKDEWKQVDDQMRD